MKYILMMNSPRSGDYQIHELAQADIEAHIAFMIDFSQKLGAAGELVGAEGLASPGRPRLVRAGKDGKPDHRRRVSRDQGVPRRLLDRRRRQPERAYADRRRGLGRARPGGAPLNMAIEVREVMSAPPDIE